MCRGSTTASSTKTVGSPKAPSASRIAASTAARSSGRVRYSAHPAAAATGDRLDEHREARGRPPPAQTSSTSRDGEMFARTGTPAARAASTALALLPVRRSTSAGGPMNVMPASAHARASAGFSDRNP